MSLPVRREEGLKGISGPDCQSNPWNNSDLHMDRTKPHMAQMASAVSNMGTERLEEEIEDILQWY